MEIDQEEEAGGRTEGEGEGSCSQCQILQRLSYHLRTAEQRPALPVQARGALATSGSNAQRPAAAMASSSYGRQLWPAALAAVGCTHGRQ